MTPLTILALDDEPRLLQEIMEYLENKGFTILGADKPSAAFAIIERKPVDLALVDIKLPEYDGLEFIRRLKSARPEIESIVMSGHGDMDSVIEALRLGAFDYLRKPFSSFELQTAINRTTKYLEARRSSRRLTDICRSLNRELAGNGVILGESPSMMEVRKLIELAAHNSDAPVLIEGESGTGKELAARNIHSASGRSAGRFLAVNCAAVPKDMFETEFFGHERGAFTDARSDRRGLFRSAHGGTLFLDEVSEIPLELQAKLLRALEERVVRPVGSDESVETDARVICATNKELAKAVDAGVFRKDLYYRLAVLEIHLPPLREHAEDIPLIAEAFLGFLDGTQEKDRLVFSPEAIARLKTYRFPGNVRELRNLVERAVILRKNPIGPDILPAGPQEVSPPAPEVSRTLMNDLTLSRIEKQAIETALQRSGGVLSHAAALLGITRQSLDRRLAKYGIGNY